MIIKHLQLRVTFQLFIMAFRCSDPLNLLNKTENFEPYTNRKQKRSGQPVIYLFAKTYGFSLPKPDKIVRPCPEEGITGHLVFPHLGIKINVKRKSKRPDLN